MTMLYLLQAATAVVALVGGALLLQWARTYDGVGKRIAVLLAAWSLHGVLFYVALFVLRWDAGGVLPSELAAAFNWWSSAIRLQGTLTCLAVWWVLRDGRQNGHR